MYVVGSPSSAPGANSAKKLTRKLSQSTLRRLVTGAVTRAPPASNVSRSPIFTPSVVAMAFRHAIGPRQVEFALGKPARARLGVLRRIEPAPVHLHQSAARHGLELRRDVDRLREPCACVVDLLGQHVD